MTNLAADKKNLGDRVDKKKGELERNQKRLATLDAVRPPWMDDFKKTEVEVVRLYKVRKSVLRGWTTSRKRKSKLSVFTR